MAKVALSFSSLRDLDLGLAAATFDAELRRIIGDCLERPGLAKARTATMQVVLCPRTHNGEPTHEVEFNVRVAGSIPKSETKTYVGLLRRSRDGIAVVIDVDSPDDPRQGTFSDLETRAAGEEPPAEPDAV